MAHGFSIGGVGAELQSSLTTVASTPHGTAVAGVGGQSFAAQLQAVHTAGPKQVERNASSVVVTTPVPVKAAPPAVVVTATAAPVVGVKAGTAAVSVHAEAAKEDPGAVGGKLVSKSGSAKKVVDSGSKTTAAATLSEADSATQAVSVIPSGSVLPVSIEQAATTAAVQGGKVVDAASGGSKVTALRTRAAKLSTSAAEDSGTGVTGAGRVSAEAVEAATGSAGVIAASPVGVGSARGSSVATAASAGALPDVPNLATSGTAASGKVGGVGHSTVANGSDAFRDEVDGASVAVSGTGMSAPTMLLATPHVLEVGITGGAHGWLRVRAELEHTGEVTASLVASSAASADALHKELGAMSAYLKSEVVGVSSLSVSAVDKSSATQVAGSQTSAGSGGAGASGGGRMQQQSDGGDAKQSTWTAFGVAASDTGTGYSSVAAPAALLGSGVGGWLNLRV